MKYLIILLALVGCAGLEKRTKHSDAQMRIAIDSHMMDKENYMAIQREFVRDGRFIVVDRHITFNSIKNERSAEWGYDSHRFDPSQRYAEFGKLYGVGSIVAPQYRCSKSWSFFGGYKYECTQSLSIVNAVTGEVIAIAHTNTTKDLHETNDWSETVEDLVEQYPQVFEKDQRTARLIEYQNSLKAKSADELIKRVQFKPKSEVMPPIPEGFVLEDDFGFIPDEK